MKHPSTVYLNQQFLPKEKAFISPDDRGFYFADGVYEVIKYYNGQPFCFTEHMIRLRSSLGGVRIDFSRIDELFGICERLIEENLLKSEYAGVYIQITRGVATRMHCFPGSDVIPTLYVRSFPMPSYLKELQQGIRVITHEDIRWHCCNIKSIALLPNTLIFQQAIEQNAGECFLIRNGDFTEATHSNIMAVKQGRVYTHPDSNLILPGITKGVVIKLCKELEIGIEEKPIRAAEIQELDECFITGTGSEIMPVVKIDDTLIGNGVPGPVTRKLQTEFFKIVHFKL